MKSKLSHAVILFKMTTSKDFSPLHPKHYYVYSQHIFAKPESSHKTIIKTWFVITQSLVVHTKNSRLSSSMYILYTVLYKENLFNSNEYLQLLIISFILMTLMF